MDWQSIRDRIMAIREEVEAERARLARDSILSTHAKLYQHGMCCTVSSQLHAAWIWSRELHDSYMEERHAQQCKPAEPTDRPRG